MSVLLRLCEAAVYHLPKLAGSYSRDKATFHECHCSFDLCLLLLLLPVYPQGAVGTRRTLSDDSRTEDDRSDFLANRQSGCWMKAQEPLLGFLYTDFR